jgi:hypothetical protein
MRPSLDDAGVRFRTPPLVKINVPQRNDARAVSAEQEASVGNQTGGRVFLFLETDDFWRDHDALVSRGVSFVRSASDEHYGTVAVFEDLYGNRFDLIERTESR